MGIKLLILYSESYRFTRWWILEWNDEISSRWSCWYWWEYQFVITTIIGDFCPNPFGQFLRFLKNPKLTKVICYIFRFSSNEMYLNWRRPLSIPGKRWKCEFNILTYKIHSQHKVDFDLFIKLICYL